MLPLKVVSEFTRAGPSRFAIEPVAALVFRWEGSEPPPDAQDLMEKVATMSPLLDWVPDIPMEKSPLRTFARAWAELARYLLNMKRGLVEAVGIGQVSTTDWVVFTGMHDPAVGRDAIRLARHLLETAHGSPTTEQLARVAAVVDRFSQTCHAVHPDYINRLMQLGAQRKGVPVLRAHGNKTWQFGWGSAGRIFLEARSNADGYLGANIAKSKVRSNALMHHLGFPHSTHVAVDTLQAARAQAVAFGYNVVVKPMDQSQGRGVTVGILDEPMLDAAYAEAAKYGLPVLVEKVVQGFDHRLLMIGGKLLAASRRMPPEVTGDGKSTIAQLVRRLNSRRRSDPVTRRYLKLVSIDDIITRHLASHGWKAQSVPPAGTVVTLRGNANVSTGGTAADVLHLVHPDVRRMCESLARTIGLHACGIDYMTEDISKSWREGGGAVIEVNTTPGMDVHVVAGSDEIALGMALIGDEPARIPLAVVVGPSDQIGSVARALAQQAGARGVGIAAPGLLHVDGTEFLARADMQGRSAQVLLNRTCDAAVLCCTPEEIVGQGFPVDRCDVVVDVGLSRDDPAAREVLDLLAAQPLAARIVKAADTASALHELQAVLPASTQHPATGPTGALRLQPVELPQGVRYEKQRALQDGAAIFALVHNERILLPHFLAHYRKLGISNFVFYDDGSDDGSFEFLLQQDDCSVLRSPHRFNLRLPDGREFHQALKGEIPESLGADRWVLTVDLDEFLVMPQPFRTVADFTAALDKRGVGCVFGTMVDCYPQTLAARNYDASVPPFEGSPFYDAHRGFRRQLHLRRPEKVLESIRGRLVRRLKAVDPEGFHRVFAGKSYMMPSLYKVPLLKTGNGIVRNNSHTVSVQPPFTVEVALLHFKFGPDLDAKITHALDSRNHYLNSIEYQFLHEAVQKLANEDLRFAGTRRVDDPDALALAGFVRFDL